MFGLDYAVGTQLHDIAALKQAQVKFVCRYHSTSGNPKNLTLAEAALLERYGLQIVSVYETSADRALGGFTSGAHDALAAAAQAAACGGLRVPIYFALDFDATPAEQVPINAYFRGVRSVLGPGRVGAYGGYWPLKRLFDAGLTDYGWQTYAWSGGQWDSRVHIKQYQNGRRVGGLSVDFDAAVKADYGQWKRPASVPKPKPKYAVHVLDDKGQLVRAFTTRIPALTLARWNVARRKPKRIEIIRLDS